MAVPRHGLDELVAAVVLELAQWLPQRLIWQQPLAASFALLLLV